MFCSRVLCVRTLVYTGQVHRVGQVVLPYTVLLSKLLPAVPCAAVQSVCCRTAGDLDVATCGRRFFMMLQFSA